MRLKRLSNGLAAIGVDVSGNWSKGLPQLEETLAAIGEML